MTFVSILFARPDDNAKPERAGIPTFFADLNLDQIVGTVTADFADHNLEPFFYVSLGDPDSILYRHEVFQDLANPSLLAHIRSFARQMRDVRRHATQADRLRERYHKEAWRLEAARLYCRAIEALSSALSTEPLRSRGLTAFRDVLHDYAAGPQFLALAHETDALATALAAVRYSVLIRGDSFTVRNFALEPDYSAEIEETFRKFAQGAVKDYRINYRFCPEEMNHIEAKILDFVAQLNPGLFSRLDDYCARHAGFIDLTISRFDREIHFYIAYLDHVATLRAAGLPFCFPRVSGRSKTVHAQDSFDLALAWKLHKQNSPVVCNDFALSGKERIIVVTGPNQGGKTTFARMFGQLHYLASLGCPVPGRSAQLFLFDHLFTHFEREERVESLRGKLEDDLIRIRAILERASSNSIVVMNEIFTSTTLQDEAFLSRKVMRRISQLDLLCVWVTFIDELASFGEQTVSMVSTIVPDNPALRTFKIVRQPADGLAYAMAIAEKYRLTYRRIKERMAS